MLLLYFWSNKRCLDDHERLKSPWKEPMFNLVSPVVQKSPNAYLTVNQNAF